MKLMPCPINGPRPVAEFVYGGEVRPMPDPDNCTDEQWPTTCSIAAAFQA
jgi:sarcosine oxidase, subunit delta